MDQACKRTISPDKLPPTYRSAYHHGLRAHYQIVIWLLKFNEEQLKASDRGWTEKENALIPITTDMEVAPQVLKTVIRCKCNPETGNPCGT